MSTWEAGIREIRDRHRGTDAIVLGCGPSIRQFDFSRAKGFITVGCNAIGKVFSPDYYAIFDPLAYVEFADEWRRCRSVKILPPWIEGDRHITIGYDRADRLGFCKDRLHHALSGGFLCLNLAWILGCRHIYLVGIDGYDRPLEDFQFCETSPEYRAVGHRKWTDEKRELTLQAYALAARTIEAAGGALLNLSPISLLTELLGVSDLARPRPDVPLAVGIEETRE
jgi:hypothetical protein